MEEKYFPNEEARERLIIQKLREHDPSVLADMCRDYSEKLKWFVFITYPYIRNFPWFEASDIVAETFLKAFKAGDKYDLHKGMLYPWLKGIANNVVKSYLRRCAPSVPIEDIAEPGRAAVSDCGPSEGVKKALDELTGEQSEIIQLRYYEGESIPNIAKRLKIKEGTARVRLHRAREAIRQQIEGSSSDLPKVL